MAITINAKAAFLTVSELSTVTLPTLGASATADQKSALKEVKDFIRDNAADTTVEVTESVKTALAALGITVLFKDDNVLYSGLNLPAVQKQVIGKLNAKTVTKVELDSNYKGSRSLAKDFIPVLVTTDKDEQFFVSTNVPVKLVTTASEPTIVERELVVKIEEFVKSERKNDAGESQSVFDWKLGTSKGEIIPVTLYGGYAKGDDRKKNSIYWSGNRMLFDSQALDNVVAKSNGIFRLFCEQKTGGTVTPMESNSTKGYRLPANLLVEVGGIVYNVKKTEVVSGQVKDLFVKESEQYTTNSVKLIELGNSAKEKITKVKQDLAFKREMKEVYLEMSDEERGGYASFEDFFKEMNPSA